MSILEEIYNGHHDCLLKKVHIPGNHPPTKSDLIYYIKKLSKLKRLSIMTSSPNHLIFFHWRHRDHMIFFHIMIHNVVLEGQSWHISLITSNMLFYCLKQRCTILGTAPVSDMYWIWYFINTPQHMSCMYQI